jgi:hypothetical protein
VNEGHVVLHHSARWIVASGLSLWGEVLAVRRCKRHEALTEESEEPLVSLKVETEEETPAGLEPAIFRLTGGRFTFELQGLGDFSRVFVHWTESVGSSNRLSYEGVDECLGPDSNGTSILNSGSGIRTHDFRGMNPVR